MALYTLSQHLLHICKISLYSYASLGINLLGKSIQAHPASKVNLIHKA